MTESHETPASRIHSLQKPLRTGWSLNMHLVPLADGSLLVHSPTWLGEDTWSRIEAHGTPRVLFAPNYFHHLSLPRFRERYPEAIVVASEQAIPRLTKRGHSGVLPLSAAAPLLPPGAHFLACEGTRTGEAWLSLPGQGGPAWIVCDAFFNARGPMSGPMGVALRWLRTAPGLCIGSTFPWLALRDTGAYVAWARKMLREERPQSLLVSHGDRLDQADLWERLDALVVKRLAGGRS